MKINRIVRLTHDKLSQFNDEFRQFTSEKSSVSIFKFKRRRCERVKYVENTIPERSRRQNATTAGGTLDGENRWPLILWDLPASSCHIFPPNRYISPHHYHQPVQEHDEQWVTQYPVLRLFTECRYSFTASRMKLFIVGSNYALWIIP